LEHRNITTLQTLDYPQFVTGLPNPFSFDNIKLICQGHGVAQAGSMYYVVV